MKNLLVIVLLIDAILLQGQDFSKVSIPNLTTTPSASRSANFVDVNGDGWDDIFISNGPSTGQNNMLYINNQDGSFKTITDSPIVIDGDKSDGTVFADADNDGDLDAFVVTYNSKNYFYRNEGNGIFKYELNIAGTENTLSETAAWGDFDNDGHLDLYITNSGNTKNILYRNNAEGSFQKQDFGAIVNDKNSSRSADWIDYDGDGDIDLFLANEDDQSNNLFKNNNGNFIKVSNLSITGPGKTSGGSSWGDIDNDGDYDLFISNWQWHGSAKNQLFINLGDGSFEEISGSPVTEDRSCSFGSAFADVDNDGDLDLYVCNSFCSEKKNFFYLNQGDGSFVRVENNLIVNDEGYTFGCAFGDYNQDGFLDLVLAKCFDENENNALFKNSGNNNNWMKLSCEGVTSNRSAIGAQIKIKSTIENKGIWQTRQITTQSGYCSQSTLTQHFGLGNAIQIDSLIIIWPSGIKDIHTDLQINQNCHFVEGMESPCKRRT